MACLRMNGKKFRRSENVQPEPQDIVSPCRRYAGRCPGLWVASEREALRVTLLFH